MKDSAAKYFKAPDGMSLDQAELFGKLICRSCGCSATMHDQAELSICRRNLDGVALGFPAFPPIKHPVKASK